MFFTIFNLLILFTWLLHGQIVTIPNKLELYEIAPELILELPAGVPFTDEFATQYCFDHKIDEQGCSALIKAIKFRSNESSNHVVPHANARLPSAVLAEIRNVDKLGSQYLGISMEMLHAVGKQLFEDLKQLLEPTRIPRVAVIHSCSLNGQDHRILSEILCTMGHASLLKDIDAVWVLNYGSNLSSEFVNSYNHHDLKLKFIQVSNEVDRFEVPSMIILHRFCQILTQAFAEGDNDHDHATFFTDVQLLYMHTKGVSYSHPEIVVEEWRNMMMYFLVEQHESVKHLLLSGEFDVVGCQYSPHWRHFSGNFWWASARYIASELQQMSLSSSSKYDAELWLLSGARGARVYMPYSNSADLSFTLLPRKHYCHEGPHTDSEHQCDWVHSCRSHRVHTYSDIDTNSDSREDDSATASVLVPSPVDCKCSRLHATAVTTGTLNLMDDPTHAFTFTFNRTSHCKGYHLQHLPPHMRP